ncbi:MAG: GHMP kinase [Candidatus Methanomethylophilaceae archaeon]|jgi:D-glycero-alpha-D-manno-heptose-7-phosphate kinase
MIITRTPLRISFSGGGSDLPSFYRKHGGCTVSTTIDKYIYLTLQDSFTPGISTIKYSKVESFENVNEINHPIFRECMLSFDADSLEMSSMADIPAGTGLGSSSSFTVGLINLMSRYKNLDYDKELLAQLACELEINRLGEPIGKQDQYAAAYGGLNYYRFNQDDTVDVIPVNLSVKNMEKLNENLILMYTGITRSASEILVKQDSNIEKGTGADKNLLEMCDLTNNLFKDLERGNISAMGDILDKGWNLKKTLAEGISSDGINRAYRAAMDAGAQGGKLLGAGGGGFMLFYADKEFHGEIEKSLPGYRRTPFRFDDTGSIMIYNGNTQ